MNRAVSASGGVIKLQDPIDDGWSGVMVAKVPADVSQAASLQYVCVED
jgi:hypothetical protein